MSDFLASIQPQQTRRTYWFLSEEHMSQAIGPNFERTWDGYDSSAAAEEPVRHEVDNIEEATLIGSKLTNGLHSPALDLDIPAVLVPSSTPGHSHLYIDKPMPWNDYTRLLRVLEEVGILERGYVQASIRKGGTFLRKPGQRKEVAS